ncbi:hypothetical protein GF312_06620 [Candidatus Poribacteria bacterium]|nr:hypothetical protein [Candidatus Poribacteria bacterium]
MWIFEAQFKLKPEADIKDMISLFKEIAVPLYNQIPGCQWVSILEYKSDFGIQPQWDYSFVEVWESKEANDKAVADGYIGLDNNSKLAQTGYYQKLMSMAESSTMEYAEVIASNK